MADTFGTISFTVLQDGMGRRQGAEIAFQHIPGSNITYADYGGKTPLQLPYRLLVASDATYQLLEAAVGGTAALVSAVDGTITPTVLVDLSRDMRAPDGQTFATAQFVKVS